VNSWDDFIATRVSLDPDAAIPESERQRLDALPSSVFLYGDRVPVDYDVEQGVGGVGAIAAERRPGPSDSSLEIFPAFDRPVRYTVDAR